MPAPAAAERRLTLEQARHLLPGRGVAHPKRETLWRWCRFGVHTRAGLVRLESEAVGRTLYTSAEAVARFVAACNTEPDGTVPPRSPAAAERAGLAASAELDALWGRA